jgi:hypothetical protein
MALPRLPRLAAVLLLAAPLLLSPRPGLAAAAGGGRPLRYEKGYIQEDTTWSGEVVLHGQTVVKRGSTLTILPGTVVRFEWVDEDEDGVGDGELSVEGRLVAKGTRDNVILFTSAREKPAMKDWTFVQISVNRDAQVDYCVFEYGWSGLQVHYSTGTIRNSLFRHNFEGIRFSTTDVLIEHNDFVDNYYGIRSEAHGSKTTLRRNRFRGNEYAFFPVQKNGTSLKIAENNIEGSRQYEVKFGNNQKQEMDFSGNWWGTADREAIASRIWDGTKEETLGRARFEPFLAAPVEPCGIR